MTIANTRFAKKNLSIDSVSWTPVVVPFDCNNVVLRPMGGFPVYLRTNDADTNTQDTLANSVQESLVAPFTRYSTILGNQREFRFRKNETVCYLQASDAADVGPVVISFLV